MVENDVFLHILFPKLYEKREDRVPLCLILQNCLILTAILAFLFTKGSNDCFQGQETTVPNLGNHSSSI